MKHPRCRVLIVDDHPITREGLAAALGVDRAIEVVARAGTCREALEAIDTHPVDVALVDIHLPDGSGLSLIAHLKDRAPLTKAITISAQDEQTCGGWALQHGAEGYLDKRTEPSRIRQAILEVWRGGYAFDDNTMREQALAGRGADRPRIKRLTPREFEVFLLLGLGHATKEIADLLGIQPGTIDTHTRNIRRTLALPHLPALIRLATITFASDPDIGRGVRSDQALLRDFESRALTDDEWTHEAHLRVAFIYLTRHGQDGALRRLRAGIRALNATHGKTGAYHETITVAWARILGERLARPSIWYHSEAFLADHPELLGPPSDAALSKHYSPARLATKRARDNFVEPDRAPLPTVDTAH